MQGRDVSEFRAYLESRGLIKPASAVVVKPRVKHALEEFVPGTWHDILGVRCFRTEERYPLAHEHGGHRLDELFAIPAEIFSSFLVTSDNQPVDIKRVVFLDTETSGLGQNPSTVVFMVGIGRFEDDAFVVQQYFMPDFASEEGLLELLTQDMAGRNGLVTFNGRCFDWPLIEMRSTLNRRKPPIDPDPHLDLLPLARRLWRRRLQSCSLSSIEVNLLGMQRSGADVPGFLIPQLYREYVEYGLVEAMAGVFYHNAQDILSMVSVATAAGRTLAALDDPHLARGTDYIALGALFNRLGRRDEALRAMQLATENCPDPGELALAYKQWSMLLKKLGQYEEAAAIWEEQLAGSEIYPYLELAKYYEHRLRDPSLAAQVTRQALAWLDTGQSALSRLEKQQFRADLQRRLERLERRRGCSPES